MREREWNIGRHAWVWRRAVALRIIGVILALYAVVLAVYAAGSMEGGLIPIFRWGFLIQILYMFFGAFHVLSYGIVAIALAQLLLYVFDRKRKLGILLCYADKGLCVWALIGMAGSCLQFVHSLFLMVYRAELTTFPVLNWPAFWLGSLDVLFGCFYWILLLVVAVIIRRILPILEEARGIV